MKVRKLVLVLFSVLALSGAMLSAVSAAPRAQEATDNRRVERPATAYLGLETTKLSRRVAQYLQLPEQTTGLVVMGSLPGSPAEAAGLQRADVVTSIDGLTLKSSGELKRFVNAKAPGDVIDVSYIREGVEASVSITLANLADHKPPSQPKWLTSLRNFVRAFPNVVVGNLDVLNEDHTVSVHTITPAQVAAVDETSITVVDRLGVSTTHVVDESTVILHGSYRIKLTQIRVDSHVVVLEIDGVLTAIVSNAVPRDDAGRMSGDDLNDMRPNPRGPIVSTFRAYMNEIKQQFLVERDRGTVLELIQKLQERIAELQNQIGSGDDDTSGDAAA